MKIVGVVMIIVYCDILPNAHAWTVVTERAVDLAPVGGKLDVYVVYRLRTVGRDASMAIDIRNDGPRLDRARAKIQFNLHDYRAGDKKHESDKRKDGAKY